MNYGKSENEILGQLVIGATLVASSRELELRIERIFNELSIKCIKTPLGDSGELFTYKPDFYLKKPFAKSIN